MSTLLHEIFAARNFRDILISRYFSGKIEFRGILIWRFRQKVYFPGIVYSKNIKLESTYIVET